MKNYGLAISLLIVFLLFFSCKNDTSESQNESSLSSGTIKYCMPEVVDTSWYSSGKKAPLFSGLEGINFPITTKNPEAQQYFNQGLMLSYGFNHAEAARSFYEAARQDSNCAMCWWGYAYVLGPNYNAGMEPDNFLKAFNAIQRAKQLSKNATQKEKDFINALSSRYSDDTSQTRAVLDSLYAEKMRTLYKTYPDDVDISALAAEALMDLHPWNIWQKDGSPQPWTMEIITILENTLKKFPRHAGANHFYIHAQEMSNHAEKSLASADLLRNLVPGSGHLMHMPSHTYIRIGKYHDGVIANQRAVQVDSLYTVACHAQGVYPLAYYPHNYHFLAACATLCGETKAAMKGAQKTKEHANEKLLRDPAWATLQHYYAIPWYVQVKLGLWGEILKSPSPADDLKYPVIIWNYAQGMAHLAKGSLSEAKSKLKTINHLKQDSTLKELTIWGINSMYALSEIAFNVLSGEIAAKEKNFDHAIKFLNEAIILEDQLNYDEPPDWIFSIRHHLGAVLIDAGKYDEAIELYQDDLKVFRNNGWALRGLMNAYEKKGERKNFESAKKRFNEAWKHADIAISTSRIL